MKPTTVLVALLVAVALTGLPATAAPAHSDCVSSASADTLKVRAEPRQKIYRVGQTAVVDVLVRDAVTGLPAADVRAGAMIEGSEDKWPFDVSKTDAGGRAVLRIGLKRSAVRLDWTRAFVGAFEEINTPAYCTGRSGSREYRRLFRLRAP